MIVKRFCLGFITPQKKLASPVQGEVAAEHKRSRRKGCRPLALQAKHPSRPFGAPSLAQGELVRRSAPSSKTNLRGARPDNSIYVLTHAPKVVAYLQIGKTEHFYAIRSKKFRSTRIMFGSGLSKML